MAYERRSDYDSYNQRYRAAMDGYILRLGGECATCGSSDSLEFDHIDWRTKTFTISSGWAMPDRELFEAELRKCQLLCSSCHLEKTKLDRAEMGRPSFSHGTLYGWIKVKCECELCSVAKRTYHDARNEKRRSKNSSPRGPYGQPAEHGTKRRYSRGCKCEACRAANAEAEMEAKKTRNASGLVLEALQ